MTAAGSPAEARRTLLGQVVARCDMLVQVGPLVVRIVSDRVDFRGLDHFSRSAHLPAETASPDVTLWFLSRLPAACPPEALGPPDVTSRARSFGMGYYVTDHFGPPLTVWSRPADILVVGEGGDQVLWPYYVKYLLMRHTVERKGLFLKAGLLTVRDRGVLVVGRGGAGKSVFMTNLALHGARFLSNSHALVDGGAAHGVASTMRMRTCPGLDLDQVSRRPTLDAREVVVDPLDVFPHFVAGVRASVDRMCVVDFRGPLVHERMRLSAPQALEVLTQFALGVNVYRLEEDLLDHLDGDHVAFADVLDRMMNELRELSAGTPCWLVSSDVTQARQRDDVLEMLES